MRTSLALVVTAAVLCVSAAAWAAVQQVVPASAGAAPSVETVLRAVRSDLQGNRADIIAKNLTLTSEQAAKFWPVFEQYQKEQNVIMDDQLKGIQRYIDSLQNLDDAAALGLITAHIERDARMGALRQKWLGEFQKVLPVKTVVRLMQIDRRLSLVHQVEFASRIPLAY